ncbi:hypothetical protein KBB89_04160 [Candidatus Gracilibacteria bacterium]|nr:hypothetical protein [Candidatus Gracilibacteria bacterium]
MNIFFRLAFFLTLPVLLAGCFGSETTGADAIDSSGLIKHTGTGYTLRVPASWESVDSTKIAVPVAGKIELALRSLINKRGFMNNIIILSDTLQTPVTASEYVSQSMLWASREYLSMSVENDEQITFTDGEKSRLVIFRAKYNEVTEEHLFFQTARFCGTTIYLITLGLENDTIAENYDRYRPILTSFTCL